MYFSVLRSKNEQFLKTLNWREVSVVTGPGCDTPAFFSFLKSQVDEDERIVFGDGLDMQWEAYWKALA